MKAFIGMLLVLVTTSAHAELLVAKGATAQLKVQYVFTSAGSYVAPSKESNSSWRVRRFVDLTARYVADAPQPFGVLHTSDAKQQADLASVQARTTSAAKKLEPVGMDMQAIAAKCGITMDGADVSPAQEKAQEACVEKAVSSYGNTMAMTPAIKSAGADIAVVGQAMKSTRFQLWRETAQSGTYSIDEEHHRQVFEMTCTNVRVCKRDDIRKGGGAIAAPPGGKAVAGVSMLEVDTVNKDMTLTLPMPLTMLGYTQTVTTTIPDEKGGTTQTMLPGWMKGAAEPMTVSVAANATSVSGTRTIQVKGEGAERGTITVNWQFTRL